MEMKACEAGYAPPLVPTADAAGQNIVLVSGRLSPPGAASSSTIIEEMHGPPPPRAPTREGER